MEWGSGGCLDGVLTTGDERIGGSYALGVERYLDTSIVFGEGGLGMAGSKD